MTTQPPANTITLTTQSTVFLWHHNWKFQ